jgi:hypothetical protein
MPHSTAVNRYKLTHSVGFDVLLQNTTDEWLSFEGMNMTARSNELCKDYGHLSKIGPDVKDDRSRPNVALGLANDRRIEYATAFNGIGNIVDRRIWKPPSASRGFE